MGYNTLQQFHTLALNEFYQICEKSIPLKII